MDYVLFLLFGSMEFFSIMTLGFILFRNRLNLHKIKKILIISILLSFLSLVFNILNLSSIAPFVQLIVMMIFIRYSFDFKFLYTILITVSSYVIATLIQAGFIFLTDYYGIIKFSEALPFTNKGYTIQFVSFVIALLVAFVIKLTNEGYAFIPEERQPNRNIKITNKVLLFVNSAAALLFCGFLYEYKTFPAAYVFEILFIILALSSLTLIILALIRDKEEFEF